MTKTEPDANDFVSAGDVVESILIGIANTRQDRVDEQLDAKRVHGGKTVDEFLA